MNKRHLVFLGYDRALEDKSVFRSAQKFPCSTREPCNNNLMKECLSALSKSLPSNNEILINKKKMRQYYLVGENEWTKVTRTRNFLLLFFCKKTCFQATF